ncbi:MAG: hypothetical protein IRZ03_17485 [Acidobacterium ailaaui]|nr:hypothetical protein [Pseudacidobacterium ailaaui]
MSIFRYTLSPEISSQLRAREYIISQAKRDHRFLKYTNSKTAWVRMTSFVNANFGCKYQFDTLRGTINFVDCKYKGDELARKYILEGGTLYNNKLRYGVFKEGGSYGSELDYIGQNKDNAWGIRPMPGIIDVSIVSKTAYGSLLEATVRFKAYNKQQFDELEVLFLRPGYTALLEWGWSMYLSHDINYNNVNETPNDESIKINNFPGITIDAFSNLTEDEVYNQIDQLSKKYYGNYGGMLGFIENFSWSIREDGSYDCTTILISRGEIINSFKLNINTSISFSSDVERQLINLENKNQEIQETYCFFEKLFLTLKSYLNIFSILKTNDVEINSDNINKAYSSLQSNMQNIKNLLNDKNYKFKYVVDNKVVDGVGGVDYVFDPNNFGVIFPVTNTPDGVGIEYITLDLLFYIIQRFFIPRNDKGENIVNLVIPSDTEFAISKDTVSIDPNICLINNPNAVVITFSDTGFTPVVYKSYKIEKNNNTNKEDIVFGDPYFLPSICKNGSTNIGRMGNIYVSIGEILNVFRSLNSSDGVLIFEFLDKIARDIEYALGGVNDFKFHSVKNIVRLIDVKYIGNEQYDDKFKFHLIGNNSICRNVNITSRIFSEQSSMIAIAAGASIYSPNIGDLYASTQTFYNLGVTDRILGKISGMDIPENKVVVINGQVVSSDIIYYYSLYNNLSILGRYLKKYFLPNIINGSVYKKKRPSIPDQVEIENAHKLFQTFLLQLSGEDLNFKGIIPFQLEIDIEGIAGIEIGQIFTIDDDSILPTEYYDKKFGFIITGLNHSISGNVWSTKLSTMICIIENDTIPVIKINELLRNKIVKIQIQVERNTFLFYSIIDYMIYLIKMIIYDNNSGDNSLMTKNTVFVNDNNLFRLNFRPVNMISDYVENIFNDIKVPDKFGHDRPFTSLKDYLVNFWFDYLIKNYSNLLDDDFLNAKDNNERLSIFGIYRDTNMNTIIQFDYYSFQMYIEDADWLNDIINNGLPFDSESSDITYLDPWLNQKIFTVQYLNLNDLYYRIYKLVFNYFSKNYLMEAFAPTGNIITGNDNSENIISFETNLSNDIISEDKFVKKLYEKSIPAVK